MSTRWFLSKVFKTFLHGLCAISALILFLVPLYSASAQSFITHQTNNSYYQPPYPLVFVATYRDANISYSNPNGGNMGFDVIEAVAPERGQELWILLPNGATRKLFPYPAHQAIVDYAIGPTNGRINGTVTEPSISIDGKRVYFTYHHFCGGSSYPEEHNNFYGWPLGSDIYSIDLSALITNPNIIFETTFDIATLPISRLTQTTDKYAFAMNPSVAQGSGAPSLHQQYGTNHLSPVEMDTVHGRKLVFVSDMRRLRNSNNTQTNKNRNLDLFSADLQIQGNSVSIRNKKQLQYYTTTSALSPTRLKNGIAYSYQSTTEDVRNWQVQGMDSEGKWHPLFGYGTNNELAHLGTFCVKTAPKASSVSPPPGEYFLVTQYYNLNNQGFGHIRMQNMANLGQNLLNGYRDGGLVPLQVGSYKLTKNVTEGDEPSAVGKFTAPECGKPDEVYLTYTPYPANHKDIPERNPYPSWIVRNDLEPRNVGETAAYQVVIKSTSTEWAAIWPKPVINWSERLTGTNSATPPQQKFSNTIIDPETTIAAGQPFATVGTSALFNTDVVPPECPTQVPYHPIINEPNADDNVFNNTDGLTTVQSNVPGNPSNQLGWCQQPLPQNVFGVAIYMTNNRSDNDGGGYQTDGFGNKEAKRLLGIYSVEGQGDTSFKAIIPANVPVDFQLIHKRYGLKWADVRSWHSFKPRETRHDCGGCHNHRPDEGIDWDGTYSSNPAREPLNMVNQTTYIDYNPACIPQTHVSNTPIVTLPVWQDISSGFNANCGGCHRADSSNIQAKEAFNFSNSSLNTLGFIAYLINRGFLSMNYGALSSPIFWAARGERTDGRDNSLAAYQTDYSNCAADTAQCGFKFSTIHQSIGARGAGLCDGDPANGSVAHWVYQLGLWIDNHMPFNTGAPFDYNADTYHPSVDGALTGSDCNAPTTFKVGYWDDSGTLASVSADYQSQNLFNLTNVPNGIQSITLSGAELTNLNAITTVTAIDAAGNRQIYQKTTRELIDDCISSSGATPPGWTPTGDDDDDVPPPTPSPTPTDVRSDDDDDIGSPDLSAAISLTVRKSSVKAGRSFIFEIRSAELAGRKVKLYISKGLGKTEIALPEYPNGPTLDLDLNSERIFRLSSKFLSATLDQTGYAKIKVRIPQDSEELRNLYAQAAGGEGVLFGKSPTLSLLSVRESVGAGATHLDLKEQVAELKTKITALNLDLRKLERKLTRERAASLDTTHTETKLGKVRGKLSKLRMQRERLMFSSKAF